MTTLADRLRGVMAGRTTPAVPVDGEVIARHLADSAGAAEDSGAGAARLAEALGGHWREQSGLRFLVIDRKYGPGHLHGHTRVADAAPGDEGWAALRVLESRLNAGGRLLFFDLETTGLAGGAGTYAFLVGCGWFDGAVFHVRQLFMSAFAAERLLLAELAEMAAQAAGVVTYNGKTFDVPLIETRYLLHRLSAPFARLPHVDMLHAARRLWRPDEEGGCRLADLERALLGHEREGDVPGFEIPARYFRFVHSGDIRPMAPVLEHNRLDLLSLACVTARAAQLLDAGAPAATTAREALGMGKLYERARMAGAAAACYWRGAALGDAALGDVARGHDVPGGTAPGEAATEHAAHAENLRAYAMLARRERRFADAAHAWRRILALRRCPPHVMREATEALAVHHEHRVRDLGAARQFALQSLTMTATATRRAAMQYRLARLNRKLGTEQTEALF